MKMLSESTVEKASHRRKSHKKSKLGCRNCKLRRLKCDETRPQCRKCTSYGYWCNHDSGVPDLQLFVCGTTSVKYTQRAPRASDPGLHSMIKSPISLLPAPIISDENSTFELNEQSLDRLGRFQVRTVLCLGPPGPSRIYQSEIIKYAFMHPYLMHAVQTITAIHDRYLSMSPARLTIAEVFHWSRSVALFNRKLSKPLQPHDRDALSATAAISAMIAFAFFEASSPEESWPLKSAAKSDLEWIRMAKGKDTVFRLADPLRLDGPLHTVAHELLALPPISSGIEGIPSAFISLYDLDDSSRAENNPYHTALHILAPLLLVESVQSNLARFFSFVTYMQADFKILLQQKDPRALVLLAHWYAKISRSHWWVARRATLECQAICLYLERHYARETAILDLLQFPKMLMRTCELDERTA